MKCYVHTVEFITMNHDDDKDDEYVLQKDESKYRAKQLGSTYDDAIPIDESDEEDTDIPKTKTDKRNQVTSSQYQQQKNSKRLKRRSSPNRQSTNINAKQRHCMFHPKPSPIKLFATKQDEVLRQKLLSRSYSHSHSSDKYDEHDHQWVFSHCWTLREMLGLDGGLEDETIDFLVISNFMIDFDFILEEIPEVVSIPNVLVIYGSSCNRINDAAMERWKNCATTTTSSSSSSTATSASTSTSPEFIRRDPSAPKQSSSNPLTVQMNWGCHHTKLFLIGFTSGRLRVIIHTCNLLRNDVHLKTQGAYIQDFKFKQTHRHEPKQQKEQSSLSSSLSSSSEFESTLIAYLDTYHYNKKRVWSQVTIDGSVGSYRAAATPCTLTEMLRRYDFSTAMGILIPSIPGYHKPRQKEVLGYLKVRQAIQKYVETTSVPSSGKEGTNVSVFTKASTATLTNETSRRTKLLPRPCPVVCQFSSIGSLSKRYLASLWRAWDVDSVHRSNTQNIGGGHGSNSSGSRSSRSASTSRLLATNNHDVGAENLQMVYPTVSEIENSVEGLSGGGSVPGREKNVMKPFLLPMYRKWTSSTAKSNDAGDDVLNKSRNVPHIKTYYQLEEGGENWHNSTANGGNDGSQENIVGAPTTTMKWFVLTSHNLSKGTSGSNKIVSFFLFSLFYFS